MNTLINIDIFGVSNMEIKSECGGCGGHNKKGNCNGKCGGNSGNSCCSSKGDSVKTITDMYNDLKGFLHTSEVRDYINLNFYDLREINVLDYDEIRVLTELEYEAPFTVIDGIVRYYGGISKELIYKDVIELIND